MGPLNLATLCVASTLFFAGCASMGTKNYVMPQQMHGVELFLAGQKVERSYIAIGTIEERGSVLTIFEKIGLQQLLPGLVAKAQKMGGNAIVEITHEKWTNFRGTQSGKAVGKVIRWK